MELDFFSYWPVWVLKDPDNKKDEESWNLAVAFYVLLILTISMWERLPEALFCTSHNIITLCTAAAALFSAFRRIYYCVEK